MKIIGLTGSIGMGKSVTATLLRGLGVPVHDSDVCVHDLLRKDGSGYAPVIEEFGDMVLDAAGGIDRRKLGGIVFADADKRKQLENILHPQVRQSQAEFIEHEKEQGQKAVVLDIPLLYETGADSRCDFVICVTAPYWVQKHRVLKRPGMTGTKFKNILNSQMSDGEKRRRADFTVQTWLGRGFAKWQLKKILNKIRIRSTI